mmetsp:Transcript_7395/g.14826  ORF Transcript_7395/g.14826 Transcript_7395/m.14826 type:complete len:209 (-) Transcript_7395:122-748(-)
MEKIAALFFLENSFCRFMALTICPSSMRSRSQSAFSIAKLTSSSTRYLKLFGADFQKASCDKMAVNSCTACENHMCCHLGWEDRNNPAISSTVYALSIRSLNSSSSLLLLLMCNELVPPILPPVNERVVLLLMNNFFKLRISYRFPEIRLLQKLQEEETVRIYNEFCVLWPLPILQICQEFYERLILKILVLTQPVQVIRTGKGLNKL